jgi:hypothetical protein
VVKIPASLCGCFQNVDLIIVIRPYFIVIVGPIHQTGSLARSKSFFTSSMISFAYGQYSATKLKIFLYRWRLALT